MSITSQLAAVLSDWAITLREGERMAADNYEDRIRRAAEGHAVRRKANDIAAKKEKMDRENLLNEFRPCGRKIIKPVLDRAVKLLQEAGEVRAHVTWPDDSYRISLIVTLTKTTALLVFAVNTEEIVVEVARGNYEPPQSFLEDGGKSVISLGAHELQSIDTAMVEAYVADYLEWCLA
jgi:hypothetical protein